MAYGTKKALAAPIAIVLIVLTTLLLKNILNYVVHGVLISTDDLIAGANWVDLDDLPAGYAVIFRCDDYAPDIAEDGYTFSNASPGTLTSDSDFRKYHVVTNDPFLVIWSQQFFVDIEKLGYTQRPAWLYPSATLYIVEQDGAIQNIDALKDARFIQVSVLKIQE